MTSPVPTRFSSEELAALDRLVDEGVAGSRSAAIRLAVARLHEQHERAKVGATIADAYRRVPQTADDDALALANANALTEAEPW